MESTDHRAQQRVGCKAGDRGIFRQLPFQLLGQLGQVARSSAHAGQLSSHRLMPLVDETRAVHLGQWIDPRLRKTHVSQPVGWHCLGAGADEEEIVGVSADDCLDLLLDSFPMEVWNLVDAIEKQ